MNPWLFSYLVSLIILVILIDWRKISFNLYGGVISTAYMLIDSFLGNKLDLFKYHGVNLGLPKWILFSDSINIFFAGIAFNIGILFLQLLPRKLGLQFIYALIWTLFYTLFCLIIKEYNLVSYIHFRVYFVVRLLLFFLTLAWFQTFYLERKMSCF